MKRSVLEQYIDVLAACSKPLIMTKVMYVTNLNCSILKQILPVLLGKGLLRKIESRSEMKKLGFDLGKLPSGTPESYAVHDWLRTHYLITKRGLDLLSGYRKIQHVFFEKPLEASP